MATISTDEDILPPSKKPRLTEEDSLSNRDIYIANPASLLDCNGTTDSLKMVRASGQYMFRDNGLCYLDARSSVHHVGHCHPKVVRAGSDQVSLLNTNSRFLNDAMVIYAKKLCSKLPAELDTCFFTNSGSEANDLALQIAERVTGSTEVIVLQGACHGHLKSLRCLSSQSQDESKLPKQARNIHFAPIPDTYQGQFQDPSNAGWCYAQEIKKIIDNCHNQGKKVAAFIFETIISSGGQIVLPPGFLKTACRYVQDGGGLCIADETHTGFGRVGEHFWAFQLQDGICPDIVTLGKPMGNGHPVGGLVTTKSTAQKFADAGIEYFNTFGGNPVSMSIADAVLSVIEEEGLQRKAKEVGSHLLQELMRLKELYTCLGDVRGVGLMIGVEFVKSKERKEPYKELCETVRDRLVSVHRILTLSGGIHGNVLMITPPLCFSMKDANSLILSLNEVLQESS